MHNLTQPLFWLSALAVAPLPLMVEETLRQGILCREHHSQRGQAVRQPQWDPRPGPKVVAATSGRHTQRKERGDEAAHADDLRRRDCASSLVPCPQRSQIGRQPQRDPRPRL